MPRKKGQNPSTTRTTALARRRVACGLTQEDMARVCGASTSTYGRLEKAEVPTAPFWLLNNCALALGVQVEALIEPEWRQWYDHYGGQPEPPDPKKFWRRNPEAS